MTATATPDADRARVGRRRLLMVVAAVLAIGLTGTGLLAAIVAEREERVDAVALDARAREASSKVEASIRTAFDAAIAVRAFVASNPDATQEEFRSFVIDGGLLQGYPRVSVLSFARWDPDTGEVRLELIEPLAGNEAALGLDLLFEERRQEAIERARDRGVPSASAPITLVQDGPGDPPSVLLVAAVYADRQTHATGPERRRNFLGVASMVLRADVLLSGALPPDAVIDLRVEDVGQVDQSGDSEPTLLYQRGELAEQGTTIDVNAGDRRWRLTVAPNERFTRATSAWLVALVAGIVTTLGAASLVWTMGTGRRRAERLVAERTAELRVANEQLREADRAKSAFLATVSHELRTPLSSIVGFLAVLLRRGRDLEPEMTEDLLGRMDRNSRMLLGLIEDLLAYSRLEQGAARWTPERVDLADTVEGAIDALSPLLTHATIVRELEPGVEVVADVQAVDRIVGNLVTNAARYAGEAPTVRVLLRAVDGRAELVVEDDGPGIPEQDHESVFEQFERGDNHRTTPGTGIGLTVVRELARQHGGDAVLTPSSTGARFVVTFPLASPDGN